MNNSYLILCVIISWFVSCLDAQASKKKESLNRVELIILIDSEVNTEKLNKWLSEYALKNGLSVLDVIRRPDLELKLIRGKRTNILEHGPVVFDIAPESPYQITFDDQPGYQSPPDTIGDDIACDFADTNDRVSHLKSGSSNKNKKEVKGKKMEEQKKVDNSKFLANMVDKVKKHFKWDTLSDEEKNDIRDVVVEAFGKKTPQKEKK